VCDLETSRMGAPYIYDISHLRVKITIVVDNVYSAENAICSIYRIMTDVHTCIVVCCYRGRAGTDLSVSWVAF